MLQFLHRRHQPAHPKGREPFVSSRKAVLAAATAFALVAFLPLPSRGQDPIPEIRPASGATSFAPAGPAPDAPGAIPRFFHRPKPTAAAPDALPPPSGAGPAEDDGLAFFLRATDPGDDVPPGYVGRRRQPRPPDLAGSDYFPIDDRWRLGFPIWDRYVYGSALNPYYQNVLKGDYPIKGDDIFFTVTAFSGTFFEARRLPARVGNVDQRLFKQDFLVTLDLFQGDNSFHPSEWFLRVTPAYDITKLTGQETKDDLALQEGFVDKQLCIVSPFYDTVNLRVGRQGFFSDFRGFLFADVNDAARLFGTAQANRTQWNVFFFDTVKKDPVSLFNTFDDRQQVIAGASLIRQDFPVLGLNSAVSVLYDGDWLKNQVDAFWIELAVDQRLGRFNVSAALAQALGHDKDNPIAGRPVTVNAQLAALEVAYPMDWFIPKVSVLYASGDANPRDGQARGFDAPFDNPFFAGDGFSYWIREALQPGGVQLSNQFSIYPNLRAKINDPVNFVNPGLLLLNTGFDARISTRLTLQANLNYYQLNHTEPVDARAVQVDPLRPVQVGKHLGVEPNLGVTYKPLIIDNIVFVLGSSVFVPGSTITDLNGGDKETLYSVFGALTLIY